MEQMEPRYDHKAVEEKIYKQWEKSGYFNPDNCIADGVCDKNAEPYAIVLPPPNVTGVLHLGHAFENTIQDIIVRFQRMRGKRTLWIPGTDHAAIATHAKMEANLWKEEHKTRHDLGREEFLRRAEKFAAESHGTIVSQIRRMGSSVDWSREAYTLDERRSLAVRTAFKRMYDAGLIYRGSRIVNWDPALQTTVSDDELEHREEKTPFYYLKYGPFTIATARPETKFGDKYVVMHPDDKRYKKYKDGQKIELEWINGPVTATIIKDEAVDMDFGTGVMTITPWHDTADFNIAERHHLDKEQIIGFDGKLLPIAGEFSGLHIKKARQLVVEKLKSKGFLEKVDENYVHNVTINSRGEGQIEPQIKEQWWIDVNKKFTIPHSRLPGIPAGSETTLKEIMTRTVRSGAIKIIPEHFRKIYFHWIDNLHDWCISRQLWYGHRIPVWYHEPRCIPKEGHETDMIGCEQIVISDKEPVCKFCEAKYMQDPDTLDTWFSSGLWTFSTLGWPEETPDLKTYHPTSLINPGYEILFMWVARMILMSGYLLGDIPFGVVYLHGILRDKQGKKFSKSRGTGGNPIGIIDKYGTDALRMSLIVGSSPGMDAKFDEDKVRGYRNFATKVWNAARFVLANKPTTNYQRFDRPELTVEGLPTTENDPDLAELTALKKEVETHIEDFEFHLAAEKLYHYFWHTFADKIIEAAKPRLKSSDEKAPRLSSGQEKAAAYLKLETILLECLKMLHPFMPFVTEEIYQKFQPRKMLMVEEW